MVSNSRNKLHQTMYKYYFRAQYISSREEQNGSVEMKRDKIRIDDDVCLFPRDFTMPDEFELFVT